ncbi:uncharacterized protein FPOAC1_013120 [Fusarium poae]|uniref:uncharacterized protein n=1 Tax=Fusarium poae TaxID=36050 RepID=UPI001D0572B9|nr:uncharacterized protein FPOAC1_013120 [Fusarium poae]KAG8665142.1 hypothetical protein FPOAC1_013120 [Fusarium poae]
MASGSKPCKWSAHPTRSSHALASVFASAALMHSLSSLELLLLLLHGAHRPLHHGGLIGRLGGWRPKPDLEITAARPVAEKSLALDAGTPWHLSRVYGLVHNPPSSPTRVAPSVFCTGMLLHASRGANYGPTPFLATT